MKKIKKIINELVLGDDKNLKELKCELDLFFKGKTQNYFDKIEKNKLKQLVRLKEIIDKNNKLNEIDRAFIDFAFNYKKPLKYFWRIQTVKLYASRFKSFRDFILENIDFGEDREDFVKWVDWMINDEIGWDDGIYENKEKNFRMELNVTHYEIERADLHVLMIGDKKYKNIIDTALLWLKPF